MLRMGMLRWALKIGASIGRGSWVSLTTVTVEVRVVVTTGIVVVVKVTVAVAAVGVTVTVERGYRHEQAELMRLAG